MEGTKPLFLIATPTRLGEVPLRTFLSKITGDLNQINSI